MQNNGLLVVLYSAINQVVQNEKKKIYIFFFFLNLSLNCFYDGCSGQTFYFISAGEGK